MPLKDELFYSEVSSGRKIGCLGKKVYRVTFNFKTRPRKKVESTGELWLLINKAGLMRPRLVEQGATGQLYHTHHCPAIPVKPTV